MSTAVSFYKSTGINNTYISSPALVFACVAFSFNSPQNNKAWHSERDLFWTCSYCPGSKNLILNSVTVRFFTLWLGAIITAPREMHPWKCIPAKNMHLFLSLFISIRNICFPFIYYALSIHPDCNPFSV